MNKYELLEKIVKKGESKVFKNWSQYGVSMDNFLEGLKWLCEDPEKDYGNGKIRMTRELGCNPKGELVKLKRVYDQNGEFVSFCNIDTGFTWSNVNGNCSINCRDRI